MLDTSPTLFRQKLLVRLLQITAVSLPVACGAATPLGGTGGAGGSTSASSAASTMTQCFAPAMDPGAGGASTSGSCPDEAEAQRYYGACYEILSDGTSEGDTCCYQVANHGCFLGRPLLDVRGEIIVSEACRSTAWSSATSARTASSPERAGTWTRAGLLEHASVASFARFALELLAVGAPADLVRAAHEAALDEVLHAELSFSLASRFAGEPVGPAGLALGRELAVDHDLATVAARAVVEGCVGETLAAIQAADDLARATDPVERAALAVIAEDEARHAELAWRFVAWSLREDPSVRAAVARAFAQAPHDSIAVREVVLPCAEALLGRFQPRRVHRSDEASVAADSLPVFG